MNIEALLAKYVAGILTEEESAQLRQWRYEDPSHEAFMTKLDSRKNYHTLYRQYRIRQAHALKAVKRANFKRRLMWAAAWAVPFVLATTLWLTLSPTESPVEKIVPGSPQATLILENGTHVKLGNTKELGWIRINDVTMSSEKNGHLIYKPSKKIQPHLKNTVVTPRGGEYHITLPDGTDIHLNSLSKLEYPIDFGADKREVTLTGEAYFAIAKDPKRPFIVKANGVSVKQYGTKFSVNARSPQTTIVALDEGCVGITAPGQAEVMMVPGELARWNANESRMNKEVANLEPYTAWHRNRFVFEDESLGNIMETLSLWYNMDVRFQEEQLAELHFTGNLSRYEDIQVILDGIKSTVEISYEIKERQIRITR